MVNENLGDELYDKFNSILDDLSKLPVPAGLQWLWVWDMIKDIVTDIATSNGDSTWGEYVLVPGVDLKTVWDRLWANPWGGIDIEDAHVLDWLVEEELIQDWEEEEDNG
jgi:hypothetical protein